VTGVLEDHALQPAHDVAGSLQPVLGPAVEVDRIPAARYLGQQMPVLAWNLHHVVDPGIVPNLHLRQPEVWTLASVPRHDVVDDDPAVHRRHLAQATELQLAAEYVIDLGADPVEVPVNAWGQFSAEEPAGTLQGAGVHGSDAHGLKRTPQIHIP
jgi:hypothetical protein